MRLLLASLALAAPLSISSLALAQTPPAAPPAAPQPASPTAAPPPMMPYAVPYVPYGYWAPYPQAPVTERRSKGMMITGIVLWGASGVATVVGTSLFILGIGSTCIELASAPGSAGAAARPSFHPSSAGERIGSAQQAFSGCGGPNPAVGFGIMTAGILSSLVAIPLFVVGNSRVPARPHDEISLAPTLRMGVGNASLSWNF
jgi:hypothetical protein